jgi:hypothetical protein
VDADSSGALGESALAIGGAGNGPRSDDTVAATRKSARPLPFPPPAAVHADDDGTADARHGSIRSGR